MNNFLRLSFLPRKPTLPLPCRLSYVCCGRISGISYAISKLTEFLDCYHDVHRWRAALRVPHYLMAPRDLRLVFGGSDGIVDLVGCSDSSYADCTDTRRSSVGFCFSVGGTVFSWSSQKQNTVALSTCDVEYTPSVKLLTNMSGSAFSPRNRPPAPRFLRSSATTTLGSNPTHHTRSKHIDVRYHYFRERTEDSTVDIARMPSADNVTDIFTKPLGLPEFDRFRLFSAYVVEHSFHFPSLNLFPLYSSDIVALSLIYFFHLLFF